MPRPRPIIDGKILPEHKVKNYEAPVDYDELPSPVPLDALRRNYPDAVIVDEVPQPDGCRVQFPARVLREKYVDITTRPELTQFIESYQERHSPENTLIYKTFFTPLAYQLAMLGATDSRICTILGISLDTMLHWRDPTHHAYVPEFARALLAGRELADAEVAQSLFARAVGYTYEEEKVFYNSKLDKIVRTTVTTHVPPDSNAALGWLTRRQRGTWKTNIDEDDPGQPKGLPPLIVVQSVKVNA